MNGDGTIRSESDIFIRCSLSSATRPFALLAAQINLFFHCVFVRPVFSHPRSRGESFGADPGSGSGEPWRNQCLLGRIFLPYPHNATWQW